MARLDCNTAIEAGIATGAAAGDVFFRLGMMYATGRSVEVDRVSAHKWFNIAALKGHKAAAGYRREISAEMTAAEIATAQRSARDWLQLN
ncbi:SEL1-like repeat protein [Lutibaculum baratangense]|uniref:Sel1 repeat family protein n=1 Tax=Lutibaculum baratangense AMV1 TaxID=631454 RepID=V4RBC7_9HYPH|nr:SEL1-like repeat protein [Lutibaculum baratangense]ESR23441.1 hypothetical protein N177_3509 [Lutibaculum baratangense AMV1]